MASSGAGKWAIAIHGGAGVINDSDPVAMEAARQGLKRALAAGAQTLQAGGSALDAVEAAVVVLEEEPSFNAGRGTVFTASGKVEMEASVMSSEGLKCGACTLVRSVRNPVKLARAVMERTPHILLSGENAERLAESWGLTLEPQWYFETEARKKQWAEACGRLLPQPIEPGDSGRQDSETVGAVAIDCNGRLAAATSTGGRTGKWDGRIGDTPINGAGNYACPVAAVSGTGIGEQFMRHVVAYDVAARLRYQPGTTLQQAVQQVVGDVLQPGDGGVIAVDKDYNIAMEFNSKGMYRGAADYTGRFDVAILQD